MRCAVCHAEKISGDPLPGALRPGLWREWLVNDPTLPTKNGKLRLCRKCQLGVVRSRGFVLFLANMVQALAAIRGANFGASQADRNHKMAALRFARDYEKSE